MNFAAFTVFLYLFLPAFVGYVFWFIDKHKPTASEMIPILATTVFWAGALVCGIGAFKNGGSDGKALYAVSIAAFTVSLTIYGEMFNSLPDDKAEVKIVRTKIKAAIAIFRVLLIFVFTVGYFYA